MKKIKTKKLVFKKTNIIELSSEESVKIMGGSTANYEPQDTVPRSIYTSALCKLIS